MPEQAILHLPTPYAVEVQHLLQQHIPDATVWAYGSRVNGVHYDNSDLDLVARFETLPMPEHVLRLAALREAFTDSNLPIFVQIVDWSHIPRTFQAEILAGYVVVQTGYPCNTL